jgi:hypothetical protein
MRLIWRVAVGLARRLHDDLHRQRTAIVLFKIAKVDFAEVGPHVHNAERDPPDHTYRQVVLKNGVTIYIYIYINSNAPIS